MPHNPAKLRWHCRRGMLELDAVLMPFFDRYFLSLSAEQQNDFAQLLDYPDPTLYAWLIGSEHPESPRLQAILMIIKQADLYPHPKDALE